MNTTKRRICVSEKLKCYSDEVVALKEGSLGYKVGFGLLLVILFPIFVFEILIVIFFGKDLGLFVRPDPSLPPVLIEEEVPESLRSLIPLARKYGIGDDGDIGDITSAASPEELSELEQTVLPRQQDISDWLDTFSENGITDTAAFFSILVLHVMRFPNTGQRGKHSKTTRWTGKPATCFLTLATAKGGR